MNQCQRMTDRVAEGGGSDLVATQAAPYQRLADVRRRLATGMTAGLVEASRSAGPVVVQSGEKLPLSGAAEAKVVERRPSMLPAVNAGSDVAKMLEILGPDFGSDSHQHGGQNDDTVLACIRPSAIALALKAAVLVEQLISETGIEHLAELGRVHAIPRSVQVVFDGVEGFNRKRSIGERMGEQPG